MKLYRSVIWWKHDEVCWGCIFSLTARIIVFIHVTLFRQFEQVTKQFFYCAIKREIQAVTMSFTKYKYSKCTKDKRSISMRNERSTYAYIHSHGKWAWCGCYGVERKKNWDTVKNERIKAEIICHQYKIGLKSVKTTASQTTTPMFYQKWIKSFLWTCLFTNIHWKH